MSSLLNKLKGHGHHDQTGTAPTETYNQQSSNSGNDNTSASGYGNTTNNTSSGYDNGPLNSNAHTDGGRYHAPKGTAVGQTQQQGYREPGYNQSGHGGNQSGYDNRQSGYDDNNRGWGTTTTTTTNTSTSVGTNQSGTTSGITNDGKRLPADPSHPSLKEKLEPSVETNKTRLQEEGYGNSGYSNTAGSNQYGTAQEDSRYGNTSNVNTTGRDQYGTTTDTNNRLPQDPNHPSLKERISPNVDTNASNRNERYGDTNYGNTASTTGAGLDSHHRRHENEQYAGAYGTESTRQHTHPVRNDDTTMMNRSHPNTSMHPSDRRYDASRTDQSTGADGEYLPGPAPNTAGPHKSDMLNKLDPRVDSDQSKLEKEQEREREGYGAGAAGTAYGNEHERRINEGHHDRRHEGTGSGTDRQDQYNSGSNAPITNRDSGYGGQTSNVSNIPTHHRKPVNEVGSYGNDQYNRGGEYDRSNQAGTHNNPATTTMGQSGYGNTSNSSAYNDDNDFECAKCGHKNTHLRKNRGDQYGDSNAKPSLMQKLNPRVDANGDGQAGFMK